MKETRLSVPELAMVAGTRGILGLGLGLLLARRWTESQRRPLGWALFLIGVASTLPLALEILGGGRLHQRAT